MGEDMVHGEVLPCERFFARWANLLVIAVPKQSPLFRRERSLAVLPIEQAEQQPSENLRAAHSICGAVRIALNG